MRTPLTHHVSDDTAHGAIDDAGRPIQSPEKPAMPMHFVRPMTAPPAPCGRRTPCAPAPRRWTGTAYAAVLLAALCSAWLQPGRAEAPALDAALLSLASWAAGGLADGDAVPPPAPPQ
jgi:hypothetical protein